MKRLSQLTRHAGDAVPLPAEPAPIYTDKATDKRNNYPGGVSSPPARDFFTHPAYREKARQTRMTSRDEAWAKWGGWVCLAVILAALALNYWATGGQVDYPMSIDCEAGQCR